MYLIKIGGGETINLQGIAADLAEIDTACVIVHGANALRDRLVTKLGLEKKTLTSVSGYSSVYSDENAIDAIMMAYAGLRNQRLVELCQRSGINAIGLSGLDGRLIQGRRNRGIRVRENEKTVIKRDFSGKPKSVNISLLRWLLDSGYTPIISIPIADENGFAINSENDDIITALHSELAADTVFQLIEAPGFLIDKNDPESAVAHLSQSDIVQWEAEAGGRFKRKLLAIKRLLETAPTRIVVADGRVEHPLKQALTEKGTVIQ